MTRPTTVALAMLAAVLVLPGVALAKGPSSATIEGPGLGRAIVIEGAGEPGADTPLGRIADMTGLYPGAFGQSPDPMLRSRPTAELGPVYAITYALPGPDGVSRIRQDVYPYAPEFPVSYMRPGQKLWGSVTRGGWYVASSGLKDALIDVGLPDSAPGRGGGSAFDPGVLAAVAAGGVLLVLLLLAAVRSRRRPRPAAV